MDIQIKNLDLEIQKLIMANDKLSIFHSGGGCYHLAYRGWLINKAIYFDGVFFDYDYEIQNIKLNDKLSFGDYVIEDDENYYFVATLKQGIKLIDKYNMIGSQ
jgi:hypothetical protein